MESAAVRKLLKLDQSSPVSTPGITPSRKTAESGALDSYFL